jgi:indole-3-glycerol phosphate synthase
MEKELISIDTLIKECSNTPPPLDFANAIKKNNDISIIAEVKKASPSKGIIREDFDHIAISNEYIKSNVQAMSVLTEKTFFQGSKQIFADIRKISNLPMLRKDFIIDEWQIYEARTMGADAVLLIAAILPLEALKRFYEISKSLGMSALVETHNAEELYIALQCDCDIIGINNRNLDTFEEDLTTTERLLSHIPKDKITISESAIRKNSDMDLMRGYGVDGVLVGEMFMRQSSVEGAVRELRGY